MTLAERVCNAYRDNPTATSAQLAAVVGCRHEYVRAALSRAGLLLARSSLARPAKPPRTTPVRKYRKLQDWETQAIIDGLRSGEKQEALAVEFDVDTSTVCRISRANGIDRKPRREKFKTSYHGIGFYPALETAIRSYAAKRGIGFGEAVRRCAEAHLNVSV